MPYPFVRPDERARAAPNNGGPGVRVTFANGVRHWFPGATQAAADTLMRAAVPVSLLLDHGTQIEYGERVGSAFRPAVVVKAAK